MNWDSSPLQPHEIQTMAADPVVIERLLRSYQLMLGFYGMRLESAETGLLSRAGNYKNRYGNLSRKLLLLLLLFFLLLLLLFCMCRVRSTFVYFCSINPTSPPRERYSARNGSI
jgi:Opioid growth factor receptor (OGFr) conserved region